MRTLRGNTNGPATNGLLEPNHRIRDEQKEVRNGIVTNGHGLSEEDESRINEDTEDPKFGPKELVRPQAVHQRPQQQHQGPQGPVVCWERFLPVRSLKFLLVENDDSTRHVVSALLRNCSYEVTAVANGLEAWRILEDPTNHIDLVLTEVVLPCLSGIGLLGKIMSHETYMNIPVIMTSSNDSMGIVFKCLSKGAVDFLVKPIRKNELKNLWQHVWRKCHSSSGSGSGSGSESGIQTKKSSKSKSVEVSDNNTGSNDGDDNTSFGLNGRDGNGSDNGSGTQSSWTKRAVDVDSPQPMSPWDQLEDPPDSTCAQVIHSRSEAFGNHWVSTTAMKECRGKDDELDNLAMGKDLEIGAPKNPDLQLEGRSKKVLTTLAGAKKEKNTKLESNRDGDKLERDKMELNSGTPNGEFTKEVADLNEALTHSTNPQMESVATEVPNDIAKKNIKDKTTYDTKDIYSLELSLKRLRDAGETGSNAQDRNALRHSAFSRYTTTANQAPTGNVGSCSPIDNSSEAAKTESMQNLHSNSDGTPNRRSNGSSNNNDMGSTTNNAFTKPAAFNDQPMSKSGVNVHSSSAFQPIPNGHVQVQHHHHHYHHHHHHVHNMKQEQKQQPNHDDLSSRTMVKADQHGPSNLLSTPIEGNAANYSLNGSASGSKNGSNEQNGNSAAVINEGTNMESDNAVDGKCRGGGGNGSRSGVDQNQVTPREAALNKFRQKRKDRCFEKKVRYQSRKKLAEQRPRVRGQFVRQVVSKNESKEKDS